jgi:hypothetical protein
MTSSKEVTTKKYARKTSANAFHHPSTIKTYKYPPNSMKSFHPIFPLSNPHRIPPSTPKSYTIIANNSPSSSPLQSHQSSSSTKSTNHQIPNFYPSST